MQYEIEDADVGFEGYVTKIRFPKKKEDYNGWCAFDFQVDSVFIGEIHKNNPLLFAPHTSVLMLLHIRQIVTE